MNFKIITLIILIISIIILVGFFIYAPQLTGTVVENPDEKYTYTKAICNGSNYCQDHKIECEGKESISISPIQGAAVQHPDNWKDPRTNEQISKTC
ncbi:MAG: hypothetical protein KKF56_00865 [Nanoarchaeota archaeon]|nr:hypothetical protein [Nanoarchaeota archaeon]